jgi:hypothetical protein
MEIDILYNFQMHPWFRGIDWANMHRYPAPYRPELQNAEDTRHFDSDIPAEVRVFQPPFPLTLIINTLSPWHRRMGHQPMPLATRFSGARCTVPKSWTCARRLLLQGSRTRALGRSATSGLIERLTRVRIRMARHGIAGRTG